MVVGDNLVLESACQTDLSDFESRGIEDGEGEERQGGGERGRGMVRVVN